MIGSLGFAEVAFIVLLALLIFGPRKLPELARSAGKALGELRRATDEVKRTFNTELALDPDEAPRTERRPSMAPKRARVPEDGESTIDPMPRIAAAHGAQPQATSGAQPQATSGVLPQRGTSAHEQEPVQSGDSGVDASAPESSREA